MRPSWAERQQIVSDRAGQRCEYCRMHQELQGAVFHVEHIIPVSGGGNDELDNLAWACPGCNLTKATRVAALDPVSRQVVRLFHPRQDQWVDHFSWQGYQLVGRTPIGRALVSAFNLNHERRVRVRQVEAHFALFPPE
jgi:HNH endonuclease